MPNLKLETYKSKKTGVIYDYTDADAQSQLTGIKDGTSIDSFADVESALAGLVDWSSYAKTGAINLLENKATSQTLNNVTFTVGADKTITATNTANATTFLQLNGHVNLKAGDYFLSQGVKTGDDDNRLQILKASDSSLIALVGGSGTEIGFTLETDTECEVVLRIGNGKNPNGIVFEPMIRLASDPDATYVPYAMTNKQLTDLLSNYGKVLSSSDDLNNIKTTGVYAIFTAPANSPIAPTSNPEEYAGLLVFYTGSSAITQVVFRATGSRANMYIRFYNGSWLPWMTFTGTAPA